ncbi:MAG: 50S ribosomal protein L32e [Candidatus Altarchaeum sp.]|nr:50S ribosomal protein L32e [Candidatus Altarchaeum sp.]
MVDNTESNNKKNNAKKIKTDAKEYDDKNLKLEKVIEDKKTADEKQEKEIEGAQEKEIEEYKENVEIEMEKTSGGETTNISEEEKTQSEAPIKKFSEEEKTQPEASIKKLIKKIKKGKKPKLIEKIINVKVKRKLEGEEKRLFKIAAHIRDKKPKFLRQQYGMIMRLKKVWRKPRGTDGKLKIEKRGQGHLVKIGYKKPKGIRGIHPSGYWTVNIANPKELENINKETHAAIIFSQVGRKKRNEIIKKANELNIVILNPRKGEI